MPRKRPVIRRVKTVPITVSLPAEWAVWVRRIRKMEDRTVSSLMVEGLRLLRIERRWPRTDLTMHNIKEP